MNNETQTLRLTPERNVALWTNPKQLYENMNNNFHNSYEALASAGHTTMKLWYGTKTEYPTLATVFKDIVSIPLDLTKCLLFVCFGALQGYGFCTSAYEDIKAISLKGTQLLSGGHSLFSSPEQLQNLTDIIGLKLNSDFATNLIDGYNATYAIGTALQNISSADPLTLAKNLPHTVKALNNVYDKFNDQCPEGIAACLPKLFELNDESANLEIPLPNVGLDIFAS